MKVNVGSKAINASLSTLSLLEFVRISNVLTKKTTGVLAWRDLFVSMGADVQEIEEMDVQDFALIVKEFIKNFSEKTKSEVFYLGKKLVGADVVSFQKTICDSFYEDENRVLSFSNFRIDFIEKQKELTYFFVPKCSCFASQHFIYSLDNWTDKIKHVSGDFSGSIFFTELETIISLLYPELSKKECIILREKVGVLNNYEKIFQCLFPDADAKWNTK